MNTAQRVLTTTLLFSSALALCAQPKQVQSLDQLPGAFKNKEGLAKFREQMGGVALPDGFGTALPAGMTAKTVVQLVAPGRDAALATLVGVKPWPHRANTFVAIVCLAANKSDHDQDLKYNDGKPTCAATIGGGSKGSDASKEVHLALLEYPANAAAPTRIASYGKPLDISTSWEHSNLLPPTSAEDGPLVPSDYARFDFAAYKISPTQTAFGIRVGWSEGYAGGGADFQALMLFAVDGERIVNILSEPVYFSQNLAGSWHKDGTREHTLTEGENIVSFLPKVSDGHFDLRVKARKERWSQVFVWNADDKRYQPAD